MYVWRNIEAGLWNNCSSGKVINITYFGVCVCARARWWVQACAWVWVGVGWRPRAWACAPFLFIMQRACAILSAASLAPPYFSTLSHKRLDFWKNVTGHKMCVFIFSTNFIWNIFHSKYNSARYWHKCSNVFKQRTHCPCRIWRKLEICGYSFGKKKLLGIGFECWLGRQMSWSACSVPPGAHLNSTLG